MNKLIPLVIFLSSSFLTFGQSDFREGFIVKNNNDTIYGLIDYKGNKANAKRCIFKTNKDAEAVEFLPNDLLAYRFPDSKYYISKNVFVNETEELVFLEYLINGIVEIYYFRDTKGEHYFIEYEEGELLELKNEQIEVITNNRLYYKESKEYYGILNQMLIKTPSMSERIESSELTHESLIDLSHYYHNQVCKGEECIIYEKNLEKLSRTFGVIVGYNSVSLHATANVLHYYFNGANYKRSLFPTVGLFYRNNLPFINERADIQYEITFSNATFNVLGDFRSPFHNRYYFSDIEWTQKDLDNTLVLRYNFPESTVRPVIHFGGYYTYSFSRDYEQKLYAIYEDSGEVEGVVIDNKDVIINGNYGVALGIGLSSKIKNKKIFLDLRYKRGYGVIEGISTSSLILNLGYQIGK